MPSRAKNPLSPRKKFFFSLLLFLACLCLVLFSGELAVRVKRKAVFDFSNVRERYASAVTAHDLAVYHQRLGYIPGPGTRTTPDGKKITVGPYGIRMHGLVPKPGDRPILAVGDSFTWGDGVGDGQTWPAQLEKLLGRPVVNAGVFGYGFDQTVLRAEELAPVFAPSWIVASLIPSDVHRCSLSFREIWKPYFDIAGESLVLKNVPVPRKARITGKRWVYDALGYSHLADFLLQKLAYDWWYESSHKQAAHANQEKVAALLVERLARTARQNNCRLLLVLQAERSIPSATDDGQVLPVMLGAEKARVPFLNLLSAAYREMGDHPELKKRYWGYTHMSAEGNSWVAARIAAALRQAMDKDTGGPAVLNGKRQ